MKKLYVIVGPTGVGKTEFSIKLAKMIDGEIINGDAFQVYKELNIGTAKITTVEMQGIPHHLFNIKSYTENFSVVEHQKLARNKIEEIYKNGKVPIIVGGSGYYLKTVLYNYEFDKEEETKDFSSYSNEELHKLLETLDYEKSLTVHMNNRVRVERAIMRHGKEKPVDTPIYNFELIGITMDRATLYERINKRVDIMIENGLEDEVRTLASDITYFELQSLQAIGYKEFKAYFENSESLEYTIELIKRNSRRYAKKQYTWFNNQMSVNWIEKSNLDEYLNKLKGIS